VNEVCCRVECVAGMMWQQMEFVAVCSVGSRSSVLQCVLQCVLHF